MSEIKRVFLDETICKLEHYQNEETGRGGYLKGLALDCYENPNEDRQSHYFAREMLWTGRPKSAIKEFERHIAMNKWQTEKAQSYIFMGDGYGMLSQPEKQVECYNKAFYIDSGRREPLLKLARFYLHNQNYQASICYAKASMEIPWGSYYANQKTQYTNEPHEILYTAYGWSGKQEEARANIRQAIAYQPTNKNYLRDLRFYFDLPAVSIVIPTLGREEELKKCLDAIKENANYPEDKYEVIVENDSFDDRQGAPKTLKRGVERSKGELVMFLGNDCIPKESFLIQAVWKMKNTYPDLDGLIGLNDMYWKGEFATHWLASKKLLPYLDGEFFHTGYHHNCCDNELTERCKAINKYTWAELSEVYHDHPIQGKKFTKDEDEVHKLVQNDKNKKEDEALMEKRSKELGFDIHKNFIHPSIKLSVVIPVKDNIKMTEECIASILDNTPSLGEILIVDDGSTDDYKSLESGKVRVIKNEGSGVNSAWTTGINMAKFSYVCVCNNDILVTEGWDTPLIDKLSNEVWMVSPFHTHGELPADFPSGVGKKDNMGGNSTGLPFLGSCFMTTKYAWSKIGPIDSRLNIWCGDNYLYETITRMYGRQVVEVSDSYIHHFGSQTIVADGKKEAMKKDTDMFDVISEENKWTTPNKYPWVPRSIDLRLRLPMLKLKDLKVLSVGVGDMSSGLARQLHWLNFGKLDFIDIHKPYLENGAKAEWIAPVGFKEESLADCEFEGYDIVMVFDVFEHLVKEESIRIIEKIKKMGIKLIVFGPLELKYRDNDFGAESQDHLSLWDENDFKKLGFATELLKNFYDDGGKNQNWAAIWAIL